MRKFSQRHTPESSTFNTGRMRSVVNRQQDVAPPAVIQALPQTLCADIGGRSVTRAWTWAAHGLHEVKQGRSSLYQVDLLEVVCGRLLPHAKAAKHINVLSIGR